MKHTAAWDRKESTLDLAGGDLPSSGMATLGEGQCFVSRPLFTLRKTSAIECEFQPHSHLIFTVTAVLAGEMRVTVGQSDYQLAAGQVALTNIGETHAGRGESIEFVSVGVSPILVNELSAEIGLLSAAAEITFAAATAADPAIIATARALANEMSGERPGRDLMLDALVRQLVIHLLRSHLTVRKTARIELSRAGPVDRRLRRAIEFMHDNYARELALEEIAEAAYLSEYHFARLFKQITGFTPHVYLANLRLERARKLLAETALPISAIAAMVGYNSQSHFTKVFKSVTGVTPRTYRDGAIR